MRIVNRISLLLALALPLLAQAQTPVVEVGSSYPASGNADTGAYAGAGATAPVSAQGQVFMQLQQLQAEVAQLRGLLEEQQNQIQQLRQEGLERYQELDRRMPGGSGAVPPVPAGGNNAAGMAAVLPATSSSQASVQQPAVAANSEPADPAKEKLYYDAAFDLIKARDFPKASQAFSAFLRKYPTSQYAGNAQYWLGEVNLAQGDLPAAGQAFALVSQNYPDHPKVPDSLYKLADVELRQGNTAKAKTILQKVISQFPGSSAAQLAQRDLKSL